MGQQIYGYTPAEHEFSVTVPQLMTGDPELIIYMSAHGGGTVGETYAGNGWDYMVTESGRTVLEGSDIRSAEGRPAGHAEMCVALCSFLGAAGESFRHSAGESEYATDYSAEEAEWLSANCERLGLYAQDEDS